MKKKLIIAMTGILATALVACTPKKENEEQVITVGFENAPLGETGYLNHIAYTENGIRFNNTYDAEWQFWSGFSISNHTDTRTPGYENQYSAASGMAAGGSQFAVAYCFATESDSSCYFIFEDGREHRLQSMCITNSTYGFLSMKDGSDFSKKFEAGDFHALVFTGYDLQGNPTGTLTHYLADFRNGNTKLSDTWEKVDFSAVQPFNKMVISFISSDTGSFGINTPTYACIDNLTYYLP